MESKEFYSVELRETYEGILAQTFHMTYAGALASAHDMMDMESAAYSRGVWEDAHSGQTVIDDGDILREWKSDPAFVQIRKKVLED